MRIQTKRALYTYTIVAIILSVLTIVFYETDFTTSFIPGWHLTVGVDWTKLIIEAFELIILCMVILMYLNLTKMIEYMPMHYFLAHIIMTVSTIVLSNFPLIFFAYVEENFWDMFVWNEHGSVFFGFKNFGALSKPILNIVVPILALPQLFHYVIDGFIWKIKNDKFEWAKILSS